MEPDNKRFLEIPEIYLNRFTKKTESKKSPEEYHKSKKGKKLYPGKRESQ